MQALTSGLFIFFIFLVAGCWCETLDGQVSVLKSVPVRFYANTLIFTGATYSFLLDAMRVIPFLSIFCIKHNDLELLFLFIGVCCSFWTNDLQIVLIRLCVVQSCGCNVQWPVMSGCWDRWGDCTLWCQAGLMQLSALCLVEAIMLQHPFHR